MKDDRVEAPNNIAGAAGVGAPPNPNAAGAGAIAEGADIPNVGAAGVVGAAAGVCMEPKLGVCIADPKFGVVIGCATVCEVPKAFVVVASVVQIPLLP